MTTVKEVLEQLEQFGDERTKNTFIKHGAKEPLFGVKVGDLKKILKKTKKNHELALELYKTGNSDAMYLAGLMADEKKVTEEQLNDWLNNAYWYYLSEYTVPWLAAETEFGFKLGQQWIKSSDEIIIAAGWATLANFAALQEDEKLDLNAYSELLDIIEAQIHDAPNRVRFTMNAFVIALGSYAKELNAKSKKVAATIGKVYVEMGNTACKVPLATDYIKKVEDKGRVGIKRKAARC